MKELKGSEFLLDGYLTLGEPKEMTMGGCTYILQCYQGLHEDEYTLKKDNKVCLFKNGVLKMIYEVGEEESSSGSLPVLKTDVSHSYSHLTIFWIIVISIGL